MSCIIQALGGKQVRAMLVVAKAIIFLVVIFFLTLGAIALVRPVFARAFLLGFAKTALKHYVELLARVLIGGSLLLVASGSAYASALSAFGWLLIGTTAVMTLVPWHVHDRFARSAVPKALRFLPSIGISSLLMGALLLWAMLAGRAA